jgi:hypothetical protein
MRKNIQIQHSCCFMHKNIYVASLLVFMWLKWIYDELAWWCKSQSIQAQLFYIYKWENWKPMYFNFAYDILFWI